MIIEQIVQICIIPLLGILVKYVVDFLEAKRIELKAKTENTTAQKYIDMIHETVTDCVIATNQTYVTALKEQGTFDEAAQKEAFQRTMDAILIMLSQDAKDYISEITKDTNAYLTTLIEKAVNERKG